MSVAVPAWLPDFILPLVSTCAWPGTVLVLAFLFRGDLKKLLDRLTHLRNKDWEAQFRSVLQEAEQAPAVRPETKEPSKHEPARPDAELTYGQIQERLSRLIDISPRAAIAEAWGYVERAILGARRELHTGQLAPLDDIRFLKAFFEQPVFNESANEQFDRLRRLRNDAVHSPSFAIDADNAERYVKLALRLAADIEDSFGQRSTEIE